MTSYTTNISIGTPPQDLRFRVDTGSSDLWTNTGSSRICSLRQDPCSISGVYNANSSSTYEFVSDDFSVSYVDGSGASGDYVTDTVSIGGQSLDSLQFGIGYQSESPAGILGLGYTAGEAQVNRNNERSYPNLPQALVDARLIRSNAYSLWLDDLRSSTGSILFGGVDTDKYSGSLQTLPIQQTQGQYVQFLISISAMSFERNGNLQNLTTALPTAAILDSGSSLTYLPDSLTNDIYNAFNVRYSRRQENALCNCNLANENITLDFTFTSPIISVPIQELVIDPNIDPSEQGVVREKRQLRNGGSSTCLFGIAPSGGTLAILGDTFLRSAYVVYDLENNQISLAQTNFNSTTSNVREIGTGSNSVPDASLVSNAVQATISNTDGARIADPTATSRREDSSSAESGASLVPMPLIATAFLGGMFFVFSYA